MPPQSTIMALERNLNKRVSVLLKDQRTLDGILVGFDEHMNIVLDETQEKKGDAERKLGRVVLRGNNVISIGFG
jgi:small nuclear ribonucleoprotein